MFNDIKITLLTKEEFLNNKSKNPFKHDYQLESLKKYSKIYRSSLATLMDGEGYLWTKTKGEGNTVEVIKDKDTTILESSENKNCAILPVLKLPASIDKVFPKAKILHGIIDDPDKIDLGAYPQTICYQLAKRTLTDLHKNNPFTETGRIYHINNQDYKEYKFKDGTRAIYYKIEMTDKDFIEPLKGYKLFNNDYVWIRVSPVTWVIDYSTNTLFSDFSLLSGVRFNKGGYDGNFENTEMYSFLNNVMFRDIFQDYLPKREETKEESKKDNILQMIRGLLQKTKEIKDEEDKINIVNDLMSLARIYTDELIKIRNKEVRKYETERDLISEGILPYYVYMEGEIEREISIDNNEKKRVEIKEINDTIERLKEKASLISDELKKLEILQEIEELRLSYLNNLDSQKKSYEKIDFTKPLENKKDNKGEVKLTFAPPKPVLIRELVERELEIDKKINQALNNNDIIEELENLEKSARDIVKR